MSLWRKWKKKNKRTLTKRTDVIFRREKSGVGFFLLTILTTIVCLCSVDRERLTALWNWQTNLKVQLRGTNWEWMNGGWLTDWLTGLLLQQQQLLTEDNSWPILSPSLESCRVSLHLNAFISRSLSLSLLLFNSFHFTTTTTTTEIGSAVSGGLSSEKKVQPLLYEMSFHCLQCLSLCLSLSRLCVFVQ